MNLGDVTAAKLDERRSYAFGRGRWYEHTDIGCDGFLQRRRKVRRMSLEVAGLDASARIC